jgi:hypothetical protein
MRGVFEQACGVGFESAALSGGLPHEFCLNLGPISTVIVMGVPSQSKSN